MLIWLTLALAQPPALPTWGPDDREVTDDEDPQRPVDARPASVRASATAEPIAIEQAAPGLHGWVDDRTLTVAISGDAGHRYFLLASHRDASGVTHWRQGPYAIAGETVEVPLVIPRNVDEALPTRAQPDAMGWLTVRVVTNRKGSLHASQALPRRKTWRGPQGPEALPRARWSEDTDFPSRPTTRSDR